MKKSTRILLYALTALMLLALPFLIPSGSMLSDYQDQWMEWTWDLEGLLPTAYAETATLPIDFTPGMTPNPDAYTENGYQDDSITVSLETVEEEGVVWRIARISIADASQLRTGIAGNKVTSSKTSLVSSMAQKYNAVIAISGDYFANDPAKTSFEYRMGQKIRSKSNKKKDILIIDQNGDFHTFVKSDPDKMAAEIKSDEMIVNCAAKGGVICLNAHGFVCHKEVGVQGTLEDYMAHFEYLGNLVGADHIGIGTDIYEYYTKQYWECKTKLLYNSPWFFETVFNRDVQRVDQYINITRGLVALGFSDDDIRKILGGSLMRVFKEVWK